MKWVIDHLWIIYGSFMDDLWMIYGWFMDDLWMIYAWFMDDLWMIYGWFNHSASLLTIINHNGYYPLMKWVIYGDK